MEHPAATLPAAPSAPFRRRVEAALRARRNWEQLAKFCTVGVVGYAVNLAVYASLLGPGVHYLAAATCSFLVAVTSNYTWNRLWTFHDRRAGVAVQGMRFLIVSLVCLGANLLVLHLLITLGVGKLLGQAVAIALVTPLNFVGNKLWSFRLRH
jgi:putative flippase GtrA